jgi:hypothetical protein
MIPGMSNRTRLTLSTSRLLALTGAAAAVVGTSVFAGPAVVAAPASTPAVQSVALTSSHTAVTSSTTKKLYVAVTANQTQAQFAGQPTSGEVTVNLSTGVSAKSESHEWQFTNADGALSVDSTGAGSLNVPNPAIGSFGKIDLTITPVGSPTTTSCQGNPSTQTQTVTLAGTFFFDTQSTGGNAWGTVGSKAKKPAFTFVATNTVTTTYLNPSAPSCIDFGNVPCASSLFWQSGTEDISLSGAKSGKKSFLFGSRTTAIPSPAGTQRIDSAFGTSKKLVLNTSGTAASLVVKANTNSGGSAKLSAAKHTKPSSTDCKRSGQSKVETLTTWSNAKYNNGAKPLSVHEQIFGKIKVANNRQAQIIRTKIS